MELEASLLKGMDLEGPKLEDTTKQIADMKVWKDSMALVSVPKRTIQERLYQSTPNLEGRSNRTALNTD